MNMYVYSNYLADNNDMCFQVPGQVLSLTSIVHVHVHDHMIK